VRNIIAYLKSIKRNVAVTAATGVAAVEIRGRTIHSFAGIGFGNATVKQLFESVKEQPGTLQRLRELDVLCLDEISMISDALFDKLDQLFRLVRANQSPFGGVQMIISGDFLQLPPFEKRNGSHAAAAAVAPPRVGFAFESSLWKVCFSTSSVMELKHVYRQSGDDAYVRYVSTRFLARYCSGILSRCVA
jgi:ATP-dependent DNA helicase PIF1